MIKIFEVLSKYIYLRYFKILNTVSFFDFIKIYTIFFKYIIFLICIQDGIFIKERKLFFFKLIWFTISFKL